MPGKIVLKFGDSILGEYPLDKETLTIGRKPDCDITVENLAVSGHHSRIITILNDSFLEDLNSTNGTYVNGRLVQKHALQHGDIIKIGKHELRYINEEAADAAEDDMEKTMVIKPTALKNEHVAAQMGQAAMAAAQEMAKKGEPKQAGLKLASGPNAGKTMNLTKALTSLGKPGIQVASISKRPEGYFLSHVEGATLPSVNGQPVGETAHELKNNDVIELAGTKLEFYYKD
ncbi:MAG: hypothetical protein BMS9Abin15_0717 [Gammaproteobacteria bacterium]|nr:MAG: hypothetical protein BMS9Abin15_0717 [Gammaproteobacteria bacterium]